MRTVYCITCLCTIRQFFLEKQHAEKLLGSVCDSCQRAWKAELDVERVNLCREGRTNPLVDKARQILFEQGVGT